MKINRGYVALCPVLQSGLTKVQYWANLFDVLLLM